MLNKRKIDKRIKCDCGHLQKDHYVGEGCCIKCGCTWYYPNAEYIIRKNKLNIKLKDMLKRDNK